MKDNYYKQCNLTKEQPDTSVVIGTTCWIPEGAAVLGKKVHLTDTADPTAVWIVSDVSEQRIPKATARERADRWRTYMSDVDV